MTTSSYARWFRDSTPYISMHRRKTFVVLLDGAALDHGNLTNIVHDLALVHVLGARLVIVHGARPQLDAALSDSRFHAGRRITEPADLPAVLGVFGALRSRLEALFSTGLPTSPLRETDIPVVGGNFVTARPLGVVDGIDHGLTGRVRRVKSNHIRGALDGDAVVLLSPLGYSPSGQAFNLAAEELAADVALAIGAEKLIVFSDRGALVDSNGARISVASPAEVEPLIATTPGLGSMVRASRGGVPSCQLVSFSADGALLTELYTADGAGTQIREAGTTLIRPAAIPDVGGIVEMIRPLEENGTLVRRSREVLEQEIDHFLVAEIDANVVGCCAVYRYGDSAELACVAVREAYRDAERISSRQQSIGSALLEAAENRARSEGAVSLFALTTSSRDWFVSNGFGDAAVDSLPAPRQALYNYQRNSKVMRKTLVGPEDDAESAA